MPAPPSRIFLHVGLHKTGTTYLQNVMSANRSALIAQQVDYPGGAGEPTQTLAAFDLQGRRPRGVDDQRVAGSWSTLVDAVVARGLPTAVISEERLSLCSPRQARRAVESFGDSEVHAIVTVRDLGRVVVSSWQQQVKAGASWTWREFADAVKDPSRAAQNPALGFWLQQAVDTICETWESALASSRVHIVTVPPPGSSPEELLNRFASVVGFDATALTEQPAHANETVGVAGTEVIRSVNARLDGRLNQRQQDRIVNEVFVPAFARLGSGGGFALPETELDWVTERANRMVASLQARGYPVVGDLGELRVADSGGGRLPDDATAEELLEVSLDALAEVAETYAGAWWQRKRTAIESASPRGDVASLTRSVVYRAQRRLSGLAGRSTLVSKALGALLRQRQRATRRAMSRRDPR